MALDTRKQDVDVLERVLHAAHDQETEPQSEVVELDVRPWMMGTTTSVVQMTILGRAEVGHDEDPAAPDGQSWPRERHVPVRRH